MLIVSNEKVPKAGTTMKYNKFVQQIYSTAGLDTDESVIAININNMNDHVFNDLKDQDGIKFFTLNGKKPSFCDVQVENWQQETPVVHHQVESVRDDAQQNVQSSSQQYQFESADDDVDQVDMLHGGVDAKNVQGFNESVANDVVNLINMDGQVADESQQNRKEAKIYVFGSSKGGTGKTFTAIMSAYRYAKTHPSQKVALVDFDIIDGQVGISIHVIRPTLRKYFTEYQKGYNDFDTMHRFAVKTGNFPQNLEFYLAPSEGIVFADDKFWLNIIDNVMKNYDMVVFDTGIDYLNIAPISYVYKIADKINIITTTSIKSVNSVIKQIGRLSGEIPNDTFKKGDEIAPHLNVIITQMVDNNEMNKVIYSTLKEKCNVIATFGIITEYVGQAEYYGRWDVFDKNKAINDTFDRIMQ
jgi:cellulose biosynthesis protein BcsQ